MSKLKDHLPALVAAVVIVVLIACTCRVTYIPDPVQETTIDETGAVVVVEELSVAEQYCQDNWDSLMMPTIQERAQDIATMLPMIREDLEIMGPTKLSDVEAAQQSIVRIVRRLEAENRIALNRGGGDVFV